MLPTFKAVLKGNQVFWSEENPELGDRTLKVYVTIIEEISTQETLPPGQKMALVLKKLAESEPVGVDEAKAWVEQLREDRQLPHREQ